MIGKAAQLTDQIMYATVGYMAVSWRRLFRKKVYEILAAEFPRPAAPGGRQESPQR